MILLKNMCSRGKYKQPTNEHRTAKVGIADPNIFIYI